MGRKNNNKRGAVSHKQLNNALFGHSIGTSHKEPAASNTCRFPLRLVLTYDLTASSSAKLVRIEDLIQEVNRISGTLTKDISVNLRDLHIYCVLGSLSASSVSDNEATVAIFDPLTDGLVKEQRINGDLDDPPRTGYRYAAGTASAIYNWDGEPQSSNRVAGIKPQFPCTVKVYSDVVVTLGAASLADLGRTIDWDTV